MSKPRRTAMACTIKPLLGGSGLLALPPLSVAANRTVPRLPLPSCRCSAGAALAALAPADRAWGARLGGRFHPGSRLGSARRGRRSVGRHSWSGKERPCPSVSPTHAGVQPERGTGCLPAGRLEERLGVAAAKGAPGGAGSSLGDCLAAWAAPALGAERRATGRADDIRRAAAAWAAWPAWLALQGKPGLHRCHRAVLSSAVPSGSGREAGCQRLAGRRKIPREHLLLQPAAQLAGVCTHCRRVPMPPSCPAGGGAGRG